MNFFDWAILICIFFLVYAYILYPLLLIMLSKIFDKPVSVDNEYSPVISILISAHNEETLIQDCITTVISQSYELSKIRIFVGSDGSDDKTNDILQQLNITYPDIKIFYFDRVGKNKVLNFLIDKVDTELVFFMDADIRIQNNELKKLISVLSDENVGAAIASMKSIGDTGETSGGFGEILYQRIERIFRINESKIKSTVNSLGALYGVKAKFLSKLPDSKVADDFTPLLNVMLQKKRVVFVEKAEVLEVRKKSTGDEFARRIRASSSAMSSLALAGKILLPLYGWTAFFMWSHRILRWLSPVFLIIILISTFFAVNNLIIDIMLVFQLFLYFGALIGYILEKMKLNVAIFKVAVYAVNMNLGFLLAIFRLLQREDNALWERH